MIHKVAVINGSLRKASTNAGLLRAIIATNDKRFKFNWLYTNDFPIFNEDVQALGIPAIVQAARDAISRSDAVLFGLPEYNHTIASPMKNIYDWLSRNDSNKYCPMQGMVGAMASSGGSMGGGRAQEHFRVSLDFRKIKLMTPSSHA